MANTRSRAADAPAEQAPDVDTQSTEDTPPAQAEQSLARSAAEYPAPSVPASANTNPAAAAAAEAARKGEIAQLTKERDALRKQLGEAPPLALLRAEVDALRVVAARMGVTVGRQRMSAGVASDLEQLGYAIDPANGDAYVREGDVVTVTSRSGDKRTVDMPAPSTDPARTD